MNRLIVVRHGNTFGPGEKPRRIGARTDLPLVAEGRAQARRLGCALRAAGMAFRVVLTGPLARARQTADLALSGGDPPLVRREVDWLDEIDHGPDEGLPEEEVVRRVGATALVAWDQRSISPPDWITDAERRMAAWRGLLADPPAGDTLLVTSNGAARFALEVLEVPPSVSRRLHTGAYGLLKHTSADDTGWSVVAWDVRP